MEYAQIREIIQSEYEKQTIDTNYNFISRFAKAIYEAQKSDKEIDEIVEKNVKLFNRLRDEASDIEKLKRKLNRFEEMLKKVLEEDEGKEMSLTYWAGWKRGYLQGKIGEIENYIDNGRL